MLEFIAQGSGRSSFEDNILPGLVYICPLLLDRDGQELHSHTGHAELLLVQEGEGIAQIDGGQEELRPGDFVLCSAGSPHRYRAKGDNPMTGLSCGIHHLKCRGLEENCFAGHEERSVVHAGQDSRTLQDILTILEHAAADPDAHKKELLSYLTASAVTVALQIHRAATERVEQTRYQLGVRTRMYLDRHYLEPLTLDGIAQAMGVSKYHLDRVFLESAGCTPVQYITRRRLAHAQTLLASTTYTVQHIAELCCYSNYNYFTALFRKNIGLTPGKYRRMVQGNAGRRNT
ncbi:MAG: helix-turn-helix domain-containing protein [Eubacteriales bacterium]|nr:helix-turn-helix domain-containing protein [Eubacteriales bacterium]